MNKRTCLTIAVSTILWTIFPSPFVIRFFANVLTIISTVAPFVSAVLKVIYQIVDHRFFSSLLSVTRINNYKTRFIITSLRFNVILIVACHKEHVEDRRLPILHNRIACFMSLSKRAYLQTEKMFLI